MAYKWGFTSACSIGMARGALTPVFAQPLSLLADGLLLLRAVPSVDRYVEIGSGDTFVVFPPLSLSNHVGVATCVGLRASFAMVVGAETILGHGMNIEVPPALTLHGLRRCGLLDASTRAIDAMTTDSFFFFPFFV